MPGFGSGGGFTVSPGALDRAAGRYDALADRWHVDAEVIAICLLAGARAGTGGDVAAALIAAATQASGVVQGISEYTAAVAESLRASAENYRRSELFGSLLRPSP